MQASKLKKKYAKNYPLVYKDFSMISLTFIICLVSIEKLTLSKDWGHGVGGGSTLLNFLHQKSISFLINSNMVQLVAEYYIVT